MQAYKTYFKTNLTSVSTVAFQPKSIGYTATIPSSVTGYEERVSSAGQVEKAGFTVTWQRLYNDTFCPYWFLVM